MTKSSSSTVHSHRWTSETQRWSRLFMSSMDSPLPLSIVALPVFFHSLFQSHLFGMKAPGAGVWLPSGLCLSVCVFPQTCHTRLQNYGWISEPKVSELLRIPPPWCSAPLLCFHRSLMCLWNCLYLKLSIKNAKCRADGAGRYVDITVTLWFCRYLMEKRYQSVTQQHLVVSVVL